jgi:hypothetical protein
MDPITLIIAALAAGAASGAVDSLKDTAKDTAVALYGKLRGLVQKRFAGRSDGQLALERYQTVPKDELTVWEGLLKGELTKSGADKDQEIIDAAKALMELVDQKGASQGKYNVTISGGQGVQVGDGNTQTNTFNNR